MPRPADLPPARLALPEPAVARRRFDAAAASFDAGCALHDHARAVLLQRLDWFDLEPRRIVDAGCATGRGVAALQARYPAAAVVGVDYSAAMLSRAAQRCPRAEFLHADVTALPLADGSVDLLLANLVLPWCEPLAALREAARVLAPGGALLVATTGPRTLEQLRRAWRSVDDAVHVHAAFDLQTLGDLLARAGLHEPVLDADLVTLQYSGCAALHAELRAVAAVNAAAGRRRTLTGRRRLRACEDALQPDQGAGLAISVELIFAQAWGAAGSGTDAPAFRGIPINRA